MKTKQNQANHWIQVAILAALGLAAVLSLILPQLLQRRREPQLLSLSVMLRDTDSSGWSMARQGIVFRRYRIRIVCGRGLVGIFFIFFTRCNSASACG